jgi:hypothetical protein
MKGWHVEPFIYNSKTQFGDFDALTFYNRNMHVNFDNK